MYFILEFFNCPKFFLTFITRTLSFGKFCKSKTYDPTYLPETYAFITCPWIANYLIVNKITWNNATLRRLFQGAAEYLSKISNTVINLLGIIGLIIGLAEIQQLQFRDPEANTIHLEMDLVSVAGLDKAFFRLKKNRF